MDIACGLNSVVNMLFVLSGEGTRSDLECGEVKPEHVMENVAELHERLLY